MSNEPNFLTSPDFRRRRSQSQPNYNLLPSLSHNKEGPMVWGDGERLRRKKWDLNRVKLPPAIHQDENVSVK